jgi:hypothetical protein
MGEPRRSTAPGGKPAAGGAASAVSKMSAADVIGSLPGRVGQIATAPNGAGAPFCTKWVKL